MVTDLLNSFIDSFKKCCKYLGITAKKHQIISEIITKQGIVEKSYEPEIMGMGGGSSALCSDLNDPSDEFTPYKNIVPEKYNLIFRIRGKDGKEDITFLFNDKKNYDEYNDGDKVNITYKTIEEIILNHVKLRDGRISDCKLINYVIPIDEKFISAKKII